VIAVSIVAVGIDALGADLPFGERVLALRSVRRHDPGAIATCAAARSRPPALGEHRGGLLIIAADHPARGAFAAGNDLFAMADRAKLLERLTIALSRDGVHGFLGAPDLIEDLLLLGALEGKFVFGSMNRGGLHDSVFEFDDRFTAYDAASLERMRFDGGKMLLRIALGDPATVLTLEACSRAVGELAARGMPAMIEPFLSERGENGVRHIMTAEANMRAVAISSAVGPTSAYTWLKIPMVDDLERVVGASSLPMLILGGEVAVDQDRMFEAWRTAVAIPGVAGLVVGRSLLFPPDGDVASAVDTASEIVRRSG
jgi:hypothetical protein